MQEGEAGVPPTQGRKTGADHEAPDEKRETEVENEKPQITRSGSP